MPGDGGIRLPEAQAARPPLVAVPDPRRRRRRRASRRHAAGEPGTSPPATGRTPDRPGRRRAAVRRRRVGPVPAPARPAGRRCTTRSTSKWFRVEWEGFDKIPREGGALMVANHAGAIPVDAPSIMHGIERELEPARLRPGRRGVQAHAARERRLVPPRRRPGPPRQRLPPAPRAAAARHGVPRGLQGPRQALLRALPAPPLRAGRVRADRHAGGGADHPAGHRRQRGDDADPVQAPGPGQGARRPLRPGHRQHAGARAAGHRRAVPGQAAHPGARPGASSTCCPTSPATPRSRIMDTSEDIRHAIQDGAATTCSAAAAACGSG